MLVFIIAVLLVSVLLYIENVLMGSATSVHDCEIGSASRLDQASTISRKEFFGRFLPFMLLSLGLPMAVMEPLIGLTLLLASGILYFRSKP